MLAALRLQASASASASALAAQRLSVHSSPCARTALLASLGTTASTSTTTTSTTTPISTRRLSLLARRPHGPSSSVLAAPQHGLHSRQPSALDRARLSKMLDPSAANGTVAFSTVADRVHPALVKAIGTMGYTAMSPVQEQTLGMPDYTADCLVQAKTGTGKTLAFLIPALTSMLSQGKRIDRGQVSLLVVAPTRELAQQIATECDKLTVHCVPRIECHVIVGGNKRDAMLKKFMSGTPTVTVATPGRLEDILGEPEVRERFTNIRTLVLDEADRMLDAGFLPAIKKILKTLPPKTAGWQGMCFSATMPPEVNSILHHVLKADHTRISTIDHNEAPTVDRVPQSVIAVDSIVDTLPTLHGLLSVERMADPNLKAIVFCSTAKEAALNYQVFGSVGGALPNFPVWQMHSRMSQAQRTRTVEEYKKAQRGVLFASDVVGRGMDFPDIGLVVQCGLTTDSDQYVHRVGRTGRAGKGGRAVMIMDPYEMNFVKMNPQFPIKPAKLDPKAAQIKSAEAIEKALAKIPLELKTSAYIAFLGFGQSLARVTRLDKPSAVRWANEYAAGLGFEEPPPIEGRIIGKMGFKGVPGLVVGPNLPRAPLGGRQKQVKEAPPTYATTAAPAPRDRTAKAAAAAAPSTRPPKAARLEARAENRAAGKNKAPGEPGGGRGGGQGKKQKVAVPGGEEW